MPVRYPQHVRERAVALYKQRVFLEEIMKETGIGSEATIRNILHEFGISLRYERRPMYAATVKEKALQTLRETQSLIETSSCSEGASEVSRAYSKMMEWCPRPDLNQRHSGLQPDALPV